MDEKQATSPLDYAPRRPWAWRAWAVSALVGSLGVLWCGLQLPVRSAQTHVDQVTRSMRFTETWFGIVTRRSDAVSPLESELVRRGIPWQPVDVFVSDSERTLLGYTMARGSGDAPAIYQFLRPALDRWAANASDDRLRQFVDVMQNGSQSEQEAAVEAAMNEVLGSPP